MATRPVCGAHMVAYGPFLYGAVAGLGGLIWSLTVPSTMATWPACGGSYGRIWSPPLWHRCRPVRAHIVAYGTFPYGDMAGLWKFIWSHTVHSSIEMRPTCGGSYGCIWSLHLRRRGQPVRPHMVAYGLFPYGDAAGLWGTYGRIRSLPLWRHGRSVRPHMVAYGLFLYGAVAGL